MAEATLVYVHDPMCSWCWGYRPVHEQILAALKGRLSIRNCVGGLAPDNDEPMPTEQRKQIAGYWQQIESELGTRFNHDFWKHCEPRRSTYLACRAVLAAARQHAEEAMILAIQQAYYLRAMNPSDEDTLLQLADELSLDFDRFAQDLQSDEVEKQLQQEITQARSWQVRGFPSWVLLIADQHYHLPLDYHSAHVTLAALSELLIKNK